MRFTLVIDCDSAAFEDDPAMEVRRILKRLVVGENGVRCDPDDTRYGANTATVRDVNGNTVGRWTFADSGE